MIRIAGLVAVATVFALAYILFPGLWTPVLVCSVALFALAVGALFYLPSIAISLKPQQNNAASLASLGPISTMLFSTLFLSGGAVVAALLAFNKLAIVLDILAVALFVIGASLIRATQQIVEEVEAYSAPSKHLDWQRQLQIVASMVPAEWKYVRLAQLAENARYMPSDVPDGTAFDNLIDASVNSLAIAVNESQEKTDAIVAALEKLFKQRELALLAARSRA